MILYCILSGIKMLLRQSESASITRHLCELGVVDFRRCYLSMVMFDWEPCFWLPDQLLQEQSKKPVLHLKVPMTNLQKTYSLASQ